MESRKKVEKNGDEDADQDARSNREVNRDVLALVSEIARHSPQGKARAPRKQKNRADEGDEKPETQKSFSKFAHRQPWGTFLG